MYHKQQCEINKAKIIFQNFVPQGYSGQRALNFIPGNFSLNVVLDLLFQFPLFNVLIDQENRKKKQALLKSKSAICFCLINVGFTFVSKVTLILPKERGKCINENNLIGEKHFRIKIISFCSLY